MVTKIHFAVEYEPGKIFSNIIQRLSDERRIADTTNDPQRALLAKLIANASYGRFSVRFFQKLR